MKLFEGLNENQIQAVQHIDGAMLILAGAGSGKTKTITTRLAYLIKEIGIPYKNTLTLTFTNKAAAEMKMRALKLMQNEVNPLLCTFHKFGLFFLRMHIEKLGRKNNFTLIDTEDSKKILKDLTNSQKINPSIALDFLSHCKNNCKSVEEIFNDTELLKNQHKEFNTMQELALLYQKYHNYLLQFNFVDFDDLLLLPYMILDKENNFALEQSRLYQYIMVDEYQDTNALQHKILKKLCSEHENICVVGDDDQSIYSWRGAKIENILHFQNEFSKVKLIKLEQNYRSVGAILEVANTLISHNKKRLGKTLLCTKEYGQNIQFLQNDDEKNESIKIAQAIKNHLAQGTKANEIAVLFRVNALSRALEETLMKEKIPYKLLSGVRFYERQEIKDLISYLRFLLNSNDDFSFKRIINRPKRGFGEVNFQKLQSYAQKENISLFEALCNLDGSHFFSKKIENEIHLFIENIKILKECENVKELVDTIESKIKLKDFYKEQADGEDRLRNIDEFYAKMKERSDEYLSDILNELALLSEQDHFEGECIYIMSIHTSKGLEFDDVFIIGLDEGFFPLYSETSTLEEERRLAYVAFTRAKKFLCLSSANSRFHKGTRTRLDTSRFIAESGLNKKSQVKNQNQIYKKGDLIKHKIFGIGRVIEISTQESEQQLGISFGGLNRIISASCVEKI
ncbi:UvrD-helicase domain-containing protein [Campylobacter sp. MIT 21-1685]|uniref:ATP-dependent helicase n=1 Tax=unclassified Campylobacter TaxID=2593542 RepID=UPI00224B96AE|nr:MULTISPECIES: UvrD-helicase domain-containing protein [unclassified Campylobacter]MCX2682417.1 UvrD-helicase domain-containing protein [Campylobacter sp. MIT 21-1684]MCX2750697.1 UvrD-helicase domain-containing protein [Campylobacter sp. MIT 21-1682]MCX2806755.1 UvrD-helicase domain-containing protein [Campylobacter sp. MIT 21-1685]